MEKTAFVTGSGRGIGAAVARRLSREGWTVAIHCLHSRDAADALCREIREEGGRCAVYTADVADRDAITAAIGQAGEELGPISLLVNNAGIARQEMFQDVTPENWRQMFAVNVDGPFYACQAVLPYMLHVKHGCIVNLSSIWGLRGASCEVAYAATKAAIIGFTRSLAAELAPSGIRVNCVAPGVIATDMVRQLGEETMAELAEETPVGRLGTPEDIAQAVAFFADDRSSFITGQVLTADGGFIL